MRGSPDASAIPPVTASSSCQAIFDATRLGFTARRRRSDGFTPARARPVTPRGRSERSDPRGGRVPSGAATTPRRAHDDITDTP
jgi:hypothetical protein